MDFAKKNLTLLFLLLIAVLIMGIGYAAIESITGEIDVKAIANAQNGMFITDATYDKWARELAKRTGPRFRRACPRKYFLWKMNGKIAETIQGKKEKKGAPLWPWGPN